jgi:hypothetical protein
MSKAVKKSVRMESLELLIMLLFMAEQKKQPKKDKKKQAKSDKTPETKKQKSGIEAKIKDDSPEIEIIVAYGDPLQQIKVLDHTQMFSYLRNNVKVTEYKDDFYGDRTRSIDANDKTIDIKKAYSFIQAKKKSDITSGGSNRTYTLDKDYRAFQYWNLFNRALNIALYDVIMCMDTGPITP